ncbi:hypothetical protein SDC9_138181 [bioreactor metagenome]|uniref:Uncharacterized protein n=1 Tax=bioreactor metagenome TaxID=1076179 RepID=A0A645DP40_9ZZZZ
MAAGKPILATLAAISQLNRNFSLRFTVILFPGIKTKLKAMILPTKRENAVATAAPVTPILGKNKMPLIKRKFPTKLMMFTAMLLYIGDFVSPAPRTMEFTLI